MQVTLKNVSDTKVALTLVADAEILQAAKNEALEHVSKTLKLQGFRQGKAPLSLVEKSVDPTTLQTEFLDIAMNRMYGEALEKENLRPVSQPNVTVKKFVPFSDLEIEAEVEVIGKVELADYKKIKLAKPSVAVSKEEVTEVIDNLLQREAEKVSVDRAAKDGDEVTIDFKGVDTETKEPIQGADGKDYPLTIGSNTFIPGFEPEIIGLKKGDEKTFEIVFPKDYGAAELQNKKVTFTITVHEVKEVQTPKVDDEFAAKVGPFKTVDELKEDIKKQLATEKEYQNDRKYTDDLIMKIAEGSKVAIPQVLLDEQVERIIRDEKQNLMYRGQTWQEFLDSQKMTEEEFRKKLLPDAEIRVKAGIVLSEIAETEKVTVTPEEFEIRMQMLKGQYPDEQMQAELDKPENQRDILSRMLSEKTVAILHNFASEDKKPAKAAPKKKTEK